MSEMEGDLCLKKKEQTKQQKTDKTKEQAKQTQLEQINILQLFLNLRRIIKQLHGNYAEDTWNKNDNNIYKSLEAVQVQSV